MLITLSIRAVAPGPFKPSQIDLKTVYISPQSPASRPSRDGDYGDPISLPSDVGNATHLTRA